MRYGIFLYPDAPHSAAHYLDAPYDTPDEAREAFDPSMLEDCGAGHWDGATLVEVTKCTSHEHIDWEPAGHVADLMTPTDSEEAA